VTLAVRERSVGVRNAVKRVQDTEEGPWKRWRKVSRAARAIRFIERYCRPPKGKGFGKPLVLAEFQKAFIEEVLADGVDSSVLTTPRGNGKSTFGGALATWAVFDDDETGAPQVPIIATTIGQAIRSCYGVAAAMIRAEPELVSRCIIYTGVTTPRVLVHANGGELFPVSNDPDGLQGLDPSFALVDEIGFQGIESWDSLRLAAGKRERSLIVGVGTPGLDRENALWHLRTLVHEGAELPGFVYHEYTAPEGCAVDDREAWLIANPALKEGFLRQSALETDLGLTPEAHFRLFRLNQWVDGVDAWLGTDGRKTWDDLTDPYEFVPGAPTWVGVDIGITHDSSAVVAIQRRPDGLPHAKARIWVPTKDRPIDVTDVMKHVRDLDELYSVHAVAFDPRLFDVPAKMLEASGIAMLEVPQSVERMTAIYGQLYEMIRRRELRHDGDEAFATHVVNGVARFNERGFMLAKGKARGQIDAAVALALASDSMLHVGEPVRKVPVALWA
jgi:phage terminase large subunit-like protein